jgi:hypothetical protein
MVRVDEWWWIRWEWDGRAAVGRSGAEQDERKRNG